MTGLQLHQVSTDFAAARRNVEQPLPGRPKTKGISPGLTEPVNSVSILRLSPFGRVREVHGEKSILQEFELGYPESVNDRFGKVFLCIDGASIRSRNAEQSETKPNPLGFFPALWP